MRLLFIACLHGLGLFQLVASQGSRTAWAPPTQAGAGLDGVPVSFLARSDGSTGIEETVNALTKDPSVERLVQDGILAPLSNFFAYIYTSASPRLAKSRPSSNTNKIKEAIGHLHSSSTEIDRSLNPSTGLTDSHISHSNDIQSMFTHDNIKQVHTNPDLVSSNTKFALQVQQLGNNQQNELSTNKVVDSLNQGYKHKQSVDLSSITKAGNSVVAIPNKISNQLGVHELKSESSGNHWGNTLAFLSKHGFRLSLNDMPSKVNSKPVQTTSRANSTHISNKQINQNGGINKIQANEVKSSFIKPVHDLKELEKRIQAEVQQRIMSFRPNKQLSNKGNVAHIPEQFDISKKITDKSVQKSSEMLHHEMVELNAANDQFPGTKAGIVESGNQYVFGLISSAADTNIIASPKEDRHLLQKYKNPNHDVLKGTKLSNFGMRKDVHLIKKGKHNYNDKNMIFSPEIDRHFSLRNKTRGKVRETNHATVGIKSDVSLFNQGTSSSFGKNMTEYGPSHETIHPEETMFIQTVIDVNLPGKVDIETKHTNTEINSELSMFDVPQESTQTHNKTLQDATADQFSVYSKYFHTHNNSATEKEQIVLANTSLNEPYFFSEKSVKNETKNPPESGNVTEPVPVETKPVSAQKSEKDKPMFKTSSNLNNMESLQLEIAQDRLMLQKTLSALLKTMNQLQSFIIDTKERINTTPTTTQVMTTTPIPTTTHLPTTTTTLPTTTTQTPTTTTTTVLPTSQILTTDSLNPTPLTTSQDSGMPSSVDGKTGVAEGEIGKLDSWSSTIDFVRRYVEAISKSKSPTPAATSGDPTTEDKLTQLQSLLEGISPTQLQNLVDIIKKKSSKGVKVKSVPAIQTPEQVESDQRPTGFIPPPPGSQNRSPPREFLSGPGGQMRGPQGPNNMPPWARNGQQMGGPQQGMGGMGGPPRGMGGPPQGMGGPPRQMGGPGRPAGPLGILGGMDPSNPRVARLIRVLSGRTGGARNPVTGEQPEAGEGGAGGMNPMMMAMLLGGGGAGGAGGGLASLLGGGGSGGGNPMAEMFGGGSGAGGLASLMGGSGGGLAGLMGGSGGSSEGGMNPAMLAALMGGGGGGSGSSEGMFGSGGASALSGLMNQGGAGGMGALGSLLGGLGRV